MQTVYITIIETKYNNFVLQNKVATNVPDGMSFDKAILDLKTMVSNETFVPIKYLRHIIFVRDNCKYYQLHEEDNNITEYTLGENIL